MPKTGLLKALEIHGGFQSLYRKSSTHTDTMDFRLWFEREEEQDLVYQLALSHAPHRQYPVVEREEFSEQGDQQAESGIFFRDNEAYITFPRQDEKNNKGRVHLTQSVLEERRPKDTHPELEHLRETLDNFSIYPGFLAFADWVWGQEKTPTFSARSTNYFASVERLNPHGSNLVSALYSLQSEHESAWNKLIRYFQYEFSFVKKLLFKPTPSGGEVMLEWHQKDHPGEAFYSNQMSDGMVHYLCMLCTLLHPAPLPLLAFDEPDAHIHPSAMRRLVELLEEQAINSTVMLTTHNSILLDYLSDPAASLFVCDPHEDRSTTIQTLDAEAIKEWLQHYQPSELRAKGYLDAGNHPPAS